MNISKKIDKEDDKMKEWKLRVVNNKFAAIVKLDRFKYVHS